MAFTGKGILVVVLFSFSYILFSLEIASAATFDVTSYGAKGDGSTDDSQAFLQAWADLCGDDSTYPTLIIPSGMTFLISPLTFYGSSCKSPNINIKVKSHSIQDYIIYNYGCLLFGFKPIKSESNSKLFKTKPN
ncbi:putative endo-polygalacturonase [Helianthus debilis subsp. tardiflorus]